MNDPDPLDHLAARVSGDLWFLAAALARYQQRHGLDDAALAAALGCAPTVLTSLRLCRRPGAAAPERTTDQDISDIARRFGIDPAALARIVQEADGPDEPLEGDPN
ncbi:MAG TPA: hypothetical protein VKA46_39415 [Gemmataceae bacterium]|nr:hypothetical protein [Gemmataceae bacterium]